MQCLGEYYTEVLQQEQNEIKVPEGRHYHFELKDETMREVNPFKLQNILSDKCNQKDEELTNDCKNGFSSKVKHILQLNLCFIYYKKKFENFYEITFHEFLNQTKGIISRRNCKFRAELKKHFKRSVPIHRKLN